MIETSKMKLNKLGIIVLVFVVLVFISAIGTSVYFYSKASANNIDPAKDLARTLKSVSKLMVLPANETPTIATVSDPEKLRDQPFFANAKKGDKVLIFSASEKAILYSPTEDKIVEVAPINAGGNVPQNGL